MVRAPRGGYFNVKRRAQVTRELKDKNHSIDHNYEETLRQARRRTTNSQYFRRLPRGSRRRVQKPWRRLTIIHRVTAAVGDHLWDRSVCWVNLGIVSASGEQGAHNLMEVFGSTTSVGYIWSGLGSAGTNHSAGARTTATGRNH